MKKLIALFFLLPAIIFPAFSAESQNLWTTGKIHVVLSVLTIILVLIFVFLILLERKISLLEKNK